MKKGKKIGLAVVVLAVLLTVTPVNAAVSDNLDTVYSKLLIWLGYGEESNTPTAEEFDTASLVEKVNYLEEQQQILLEAVEDTKNAATASYSLFVYVPKSLALSNYSGREIKITSASGNQSATAVLEDNGANYSTVLYFNFSGNCRLDYKLLSSSGQEVSATKPVTITVTGQEQLVAAPSDIPWAGIHGICQAGLASDFGLTTEGTELHGGWYVIGSKLENGVDSLRIWRKTNLGNVGPYGSLESQDTYYSTFNNQEGVSLAYSSGLLSTADVGAGWLASNRTTGFNYWLSNTRSNSQSTAYYRYYVMSNGGVNYDYATSYGYCPYVWIH